MDRKQPVLHLQQLFHVENRTGALDTTFKILEVASILLHNAHKETKRAKSEHSFTPFYFLNYR